MNDNESIDKTFLPRVKIERTLFKIRNLMIMVKLASQDGDIAGNEVDFAIAINGIVTSVEGEINDLIQDIIPNCY